MLAEDMHWNTNNMIYGDDIIQMSHGTLLPSTPAIRQNANLYVYCHNNPLAFFDPTGAEEGELVRGFPNAPMRKMVINENFFDFSKPYSTGYFDDTEPYTIRGLYLKRSALWPPEFNNGFKPYIEAGLAKTRADYKYGGWSMSAVTAEAQAGVVVDTKRHNYFLGGGAGAHLVQIEGHANIPTEYALTFNCPPVQFVTAT
jgi:hypothetical protein